jgi:pimeloyl-ACP methyl ester carboxylesterase
MRARKIFYTLLTIVLILGALEFFLYKFFADLIHVPKKDQAFDPQGLLFTSNDIHFKSDDGADLYGWLIHGKAGYPGLIIAHDFRSNRSEVLGKLEGLITSLNKEGYFIFLFDFRGHGNSSSKSSLGVRESADLEAALKAILKYGQVERRVGVLGIGMGAVAACKAGKVADEVKLIILDSIYESIPAKSSETIFTGWKFIEPARPVIIQATDWNMRLLLGVPTTELKLEEELPLLYPRAVVFVEKKPLRPEAKALYDAAREPKELIQLEETAAGDLLGDPRKAYEMQITQKIRKYLPPFVKEQTMELPKN